MRKIFYIILLFLLAFTFTGNPPGWYNQPIPVNKVINDIYFLDSLTGWAVSTWDPQFDTAYVLHTTDGGINWNVQFQTEAAFNVIQFTDNNTGYIGGGDGFPKMYKTTDKGQNWFTLNPAPLHLVVNIFFVNNDTGWVCDDDPLFGGLYKTTNGGLNWVEQMDETFKPFKIFFTGKDTGYVLSPGSSSRLYKTINGGLNWGNVHTFSTTTGTIYFLDNTTGFVTGSFGSSSVQKTTDGGVSWVTMNNSTGGRDMIFINENTGWVCDLFSTMQKTVDGGLNWNGQNVPPGFYYCIHFVDTLHGWAGGAGSGSGKIISTTDGGGPTSITQINNEIPTEFSLYQNYPNPFNPTTSIKFNVQSSKKVKLSVFDITGRELAALLDEKLLPGEYEYKFDGSNLTSGIYFYTLIADGISVDTKKMLLIK